MKFFFLATTILLLFIGILTAAPASAIDVLPSKGLVPDCERTEQWTYTTGVGGKDTKDKKVTNEPCTVAHFLQMLINLIEWFLAILGAAAFLMFFYGGILFVFSLGNAQRITQGKNILVNTILAIVVILGAYTAVKIISAALGVDIGL